MNLDQARALAAAARENTSAGLEAREQLADLIDQLADALDGFLGSGNATTEVQWTTRMRWADGRQEDSEFPVGEKLARHRFETYPYHVTLLARAVTTIERPWVEVASKAAADV